MELESGHHEGISISSSDHHHHYQHQHQPHPQPHQQPHPMPIPQQSTFGVVHPAGSPAAGAGAGAGAGGGTPIAAISQPLLMHEASATKLKLMANSGNGGSATGPAGAAVTVTTSTPLLLACQQKEQQNQVAADQAREILRAAVSAVAQEATPPRVVESAKVGAVLLRSSKSGTAGAVRYRECQKNHAAGIGGHALDGCGEFMPGGEEGSVDALRCAACDCHRNFHRREVEGEVPPCECRRLTPGAGKLMKPSPIGGLITPGGGGGGHHQQHHHQHQQQLTPSSAAGGQLATMQQTTPGTTLALAPVNMQAVMVQRPIAPSSTVTMQQPMSAGPGPADSDDGDDGGMSGGAGGVIGGGGGVAGMMSRSPSSIKKRFRTKFSGEQKEKMCDFADKLGWRIQKHDELAVQEFCSTVGVKRHVLKVWMHNNKHTLGKKAASL